MRKCLCLCGCQRERERERERVIGCLCCLLTSERVGESDVLGTVGIKVCVVGRESVCAYGSVR